MSIDLPNDLPRRYRYSFRAWFFAKAWRYSYELVGASGGMHLHISGPHHYDGQDNWSAGLECHWRQPPHYMRHDPPSHDECWLLKCPCWHDGTSLHAQEHYLPMFLNGRHARIFHELVRDADERLGVIVDEDGETA